MKKTLKDVVLDIIKTAKNNAFFNPIETPEDLTEELITGIELYTNYDPATESALDEFTNKLRLYELNGYRLNQNIGLPFDASRWGARKWIDWIDQNGEWIEPVYEVFDNAIIKGKYIVITEGDGNPRQLDRKKRLGLEDYHPTGPIAMETYINTATFENAINRRKVFGDRYGKSVICRLVPVDEKTGEDL